MTNNYFKRLSLALVLMALTVTVGFLLYVTFQPEQLIINFVTWFIALIWLVRIAFLGSVMQPVPEKMTGAARWRVSFILVVFIWSIPAISVIQATSANSRDAIIVALTKGGGSGIPEVLCILAVTILIILIPGYLNARGPKWKEKSYAPGWLAGFAALFTGAYVVLLHFARGALAGLHVGTVYFAAFGVALLLAPLYRAIASACWRYGSFRVLDPCCWWQSFYATFREMRGKGVIAPAARKISSAETRDSKTPPGSD